MADVTTELLKARLRRLRLPTMGLGFEGPARAAAANDQTPAELLPRLTEVELASRSANAVALGSRTPDSRWRRTPTPATSA